ncbi:ATP-binding protein [Thermofilum pendens]|uniref:ATPase, AAA superfamily n=1 Tax=Thermofilum pendens (strain DSM 2475 / Hrk 5) TaxID=368408 RepID=A1RZN0_THEPD|nr:ATP-binding protein [Thermofilum pendens]ABL78660.1 ATPase, AAA superfamily [Thermofilum pendens Hrk 5]
MGFLRELTEEYLGSLKYVARIVPREVELPRESPDIVAVVGPRRSGKTFVMLRSVERDLAEGLQALYVPLDEPSLRRLDARRFAEMVREEYREGRVRLYMDEVQDWEDWDSKLRWLHDVKDFQLYVTGSSSALQSSEIPSRLRGRYVSRLVLPFSFREVARAELGAEPSTFRERGALKGLLREYLAWGGFPEVWLYRSREKAVALLETMFYRDIVERHRVREPEALLELAYVVLSSYASPVTWRSLARSLKGLGVEVDAKTAASYVEYMRQAFLVFVVKRFAYSERLRARSPRKVYVVDPAVASLFERPLDLGRRAENVVLVELVRRGCEPGYYVTSRGREVDFAAKCGGSLRLVEVCLEVEEGHVRKVAEAMRELRLREAELVSWDDEDEREVEGGRVRVVPLWKWLLGA